MPKTKIKTIIAHEDEIEDEVNNFQNSEEMLNSTIESVSVSNLSSGKCCICILYSEIKILKLNS